MGGVALVVGVTGALGRYALRLARTLWNEGAAAAIAAMVAEVLDGVAPEVGGVDDDEAGLARARLAAARAAGWKRGVSGGEGKVGGGGGRRPGGGRPPAAEAAANAAGLRRKGFPRGNLATPGDGRRGLPGPSNGLRAPTAAM